MSDKMVTALGWLIVLAFVAAIVLFRLWITGPECFFAQDVGVCQAIRDVNR